MKIASLTVVSIVLLLSGTAAIAGPRDAEATLNRCGSPLKGDEIVYENSVSGGHRTLQYERGSLVFQRLGNTGWTFSYGAQGDAQLSTTEVAKRFPCLELALSDSAASAPLPKITTTNRLESSLKDSYRQMILYSIVALAGFGALLFALSKRQSSSDDSLS